MSKKKNKKHSSKDSSSKNEFKERHMEFASLLPEIVFETDAKGNIVYANEIAFKSFGYSRKEFDEGINAIQTLAPKDRDRARKSIGKIMRGEKVDANEYTAIRKDGSTFPVAIHSAPIIYGNKPVGMMGVMVDLSNLKQAEQKYRILFDSSPDLIAEADEEGNFLTVNSAMAKSLGCSIDELIGKNGYDVLPKEVVDKRLQIARKAMKENKIQEWSDFRAGRYFYNSYVPIVDVVGKKRIQLIARDITEQKSVEEKYKRLFDSFPDGICEVDEAGATIISINHVMAKNFGCKPEDMIGKAFSDFLPKKLYDYQYKIGRKALDKNKIQEFEDERAGRYFYNTFVPIISKNGKKYIQIVSRDVTNRRRAELKYRTLFESSRDAIMMLSPPSWAFIAGNPSAFKMFNAKNEKEFTASDPWTLSPEFQPDGQLSSEKAKKMIEKAMKTGSNFFEWTHKKLGGKEFPATVLLTKIELEGKQLLQATVRDVTKQEEIEKSLREAHDELEKRVKERTAELTETYEKLQESERKYRLLFDVSPVGIGVVDVKGNFIDGNAAMEEMTGYSIDELKSKGLGDNYANPDDRKRLVKELQKKGRVRDWEVKLKNKAGEVYYSIVDFETIDLYGRKGYITIQRDISKQRDYEQEIIQTKNRLQNVIDGASEIILAVNQNNNMSTWNKTAEDVTHYKQKQIVGKNLAKLKVFDRPKELEEYIKNVYDGYVGGLDLILRTRLGSKKIFRVHGSIIEKGKQLQGAILIGYDVTGDSEAHGKLLPGNGYLLTDENIKPSLDLFVGLITSEHDGLFITRTSLNDIQNTFPSIDVDIVYLSQENIKGVECIYDPNTLAEKIDEFTSKHSKPAVLLDRIDYLLSNFSFGEVMNVLYKINDIIARNNAILLLRLNPLILEKQQFMLIKEELKPLPSKRVEDIELEDTLFDILTFVYGQNKQNVLVSYQKISQEFSISKVTTGKRLSILKDKNLVSIKMKGRLKSVSLTGKGEALLNRRMAV